MWLILKSMIKSAISGERELNLLLRGCFLCAHSKQDMDKDSWLAFVFWAPKRSNHRASLCDVTRSKDLRLLSRAQCVCKGRMERWVQYRLSSEVSLWSFIQRVKYAKHNSSERLDVSAASVVPWSSIWLLAPRSLMHTLGWGTSTLRQGVRLALRTPR